MDGADAILDEPEVLAASVVMPDDQLSGHRSERLGLGRDAIDPLGFVGDGLEVEDRRVRRARPQPAGGIQVPPAAERRRTTARSSELKVVCQRLGDQSTACRVARVLEITFINQCLDDGEPAPSGVGARSGSGQGNPARKRRRCTSWTVSRVALDSRGW